jgi:hypothetical protein
MNSNPTGACLIIILIIDLGVPRIRHVRRMFRFAANRTDGVAATDDGESGLCGRRRRKVSSM